MADGDVVKESLLMRFKDAGTQTSKMQFGAAATIPLAKTFLATYTNCTVVGASHVEELACAAVAGSGTEDDNVDKKLIITAKDSVTGDKIRFVVPGYKGVTFVQGEKGLRVDDTSGAAICAAWKTANALPNALTFLRGTPVMRA